MNLKDFLAQMSVAERKKFALQCRTTAGHLRNISYGYRTCAESLAIAIERESGGVVRCESLRADVDWDYLRGSAKRRRGGRAA